MSNDEIVIQLQQILATLKRIVEASGQLAERVDALEHNSAEKLGVLTSLQGHLEVLLDTYQKQSAAQARTNELLEARIAALEDAR